MPSSAEDPQSQPTEELGRDFSTIDLCALLPVEEVAEWAGGTPKDQPSTNRNGDIVDCWYTIVTEENNLGDIYIAYVMPAEIAAFGQDEPSEPLSGIGDYGSILYSEAERQHRLLAYREGDIGINTLGKRRQAVIAMAEALFERIPALR